MQDDEAVDRLLKDAMSMAAPELAPGFDARVLRRVRPRRLTRTGRVLMTVYATVAVLATAWFMRELPITWLAVAAAATVIVAAGTSAYSRRLVAG